MAHAFFFFFKAVDSSLEAMVVHMQSTVVLHNPFH